MTVADGAMDRTRTRRPRWIKVAVVVGCLAVVASLLVPAGLGRLRGSLTVATAGSDGSGGRLALVEGVLGGEQTSSSTACFWVETPAGRIYIRWPHGWTAKPRPLKAVDHWGLNGAAVGKSVDIGGAAATDGEPALVGCVLPPDAVVFSAADVSPAPQA